MHVRTVKYVCLAAHRWDLGFGLMITAAVVQAYGHGVLAWSIEYIGYHSREH